MNALDLTRLIGGICWLLVWVFLAGSMWRLFQGPSRPNDPIWSLFWFLSGHQLGYTVRWLLAWSAPHQIGSVDFWSVLGLNIMSAMLALAIVRLRYVVEGRRW